MSSLCSPLLYRYLCQQACREAYPKWDAVLNKMSAGRTKAQKKDIFFEDYLQRKKDALQKNVP